MNAYSQVVSIGLLWVTIHCAGMCGPIIAGVTTSRHKTGSIWSRVPRVLAYQLGRAVTYAGFGVAAGLLGAVFESQIRTFANAAGLVLSLALIGVGISQVPWVRRRFKPGGNFGVDFSSKLLGLLKGTRGMGDFPRLFLTGLLLGFLPCMLMFWVLSVAASTASALHGAGVMVLLVAMTTPVLIFSSLMAGLPIRRFGEHLVPVALILSGVWMGLVAIASNGWIDHIHLQFKMFGEGYVFMLW